MVSAGMTQGNRCPGIPEWRYGMELPPEDQVELGIYRKHKLVLSLLCRLRAACSQETL